jgi:hypothetical protein
MASAGNGNTRSEKEAVVYHSRPENDEDANLSTRVLAALDSVPGYDIENSETVLFDHIDLDALDELFKPVAGQPRHGEVTFPVDQYEVTVTADGEITIRQSSDN